MAMGKIEAVFHCVGTTEEEIDRFIKAAIGAAKKRSTNSQKPSRNTIKTCGSMVKRVEDFKYAPL